MDEELKAYLTEMKRELKEHTESAEARLLGEFWNWAKTADIRYRQGTSVVGFLNDRLEAIEHRVAELERDRRKAG